MSNYRRVFVPGGVYFFTVVTHERARIFTSEERVEVLRAAFRKIMAVRPYRMDAVVILPDHLHCLWRLPAGMTIIQGGGGRSKRGSHGKLTHGLIIVTSGRYGNGGFGNMPLETKKTGAITWIISITIRSVMDSWLVPAIGGGPLLPGLYPGGGMRNPGERVNRRQLVV